MQLQMVDLSGQYKKIKPAIDAAIQDVLDKARFVKGPQIKEFEESLAKELDVKHLIACANGTDALQIAMMALNLKPGDEVILPVFTYVATAEVIALLGLIPVMVDVDPGTFCIDTSLIESKITPKTKAIVPVHLFGQCANMNDIMRIANKHNLFVIEDTAQAIGSNYELLIMNDEIKAKSLHNSSFITHNYSNAETTRKVSAGCIGNIGTTSFFPSKNLGCYGDGGALFTNDDDLAKKIRMICNHGQSVQYVHDIIGVNSRLDTMQAAILNVKLKHLREYESARNQAAHWYDELLGNHPQIIIPKRNPDSTHVFHQYTIRVMSDELGVMSDNQKTHTSYLITQNSKRNKLREALAKKGIPTMVYYPIELHKQKAFAKYWNGVDQFPVSEALCSSVLSLPMHTELTREMVEFVAEGVLQCLDSL